MPKRAHALNRKKRRKSRRAKHILDDASDEFDHFGMDDDDEREPFRPEEIDVRRERERQEAWAHDLAEEERICEERPDEGVEFDSTCRDARTEAIWEAERRRQTEYDEAEAREALERPRRRKPRKGSGRMNLSEALEWSGE